MTLGRRRISIAIGALVGAWWLSGVVVLFALTARPKPLFEEPLPSAEWADFESLRLGTRDGENLGAWFAEPSPESTGPGGGVAVLLLHGYSGSRTWLLDRMRPYLDQGHSVLALTLRAHGDSTGDFVDYGLSSRHDVLAGVEKLETRSPGRPILIHGFSLGSAAAVFAAEELQNRVAAYVLDSPYQTISIAVRNRTHRALWQPFADIAWLALVAASPLRLDIGELRPVDAVRNIPDGTPVLIMSGGQDTHARPAEARAIAAAIGSSARVATIPEATHGHLSVENPELYWSTVFAFLDDWIAHRPGSDSNSVESR